MLDRATSPGTALIDRLRDETRDLHEGLERDLDWRRRMSSVDGHRGLLARWWGFHAVFEPLIEAHPPFPGLGPRRKLHLLEADLRALGMPDAGIQALPRIRRQSLPNDWAGLVGAMYVLEGSTLGGQVIARYVRTVLAGTVAHGAYAYYEAYGRTHVGPMWRAFQERLSTEVPHGSHDEVIAGARRTFAALRAWLAPDDPQGTGRP